MCSISLASRLPSCTASHCCSSSLVLVAAGAAFQAGMLLCLGGAAICLFGLVARFVSREQIRQFFSPPLMEAAAYLTCVVAYEASRSEIRGLVLNAFNWCQRYDGK